MLDLFSAKSSSGRRDIKTNRQNKRWRGGGVRRKKKKVFVNLEESDEIQEMGSQPMAVMGRALPHHAASTSYSAEEMSRSSPGQGLL